MKKVVIISAVAMLLVAGSIAAAGTSMVGKKVAKEVQIEVDGKRAKNAAIIIDGVTYAPVREVGEMTGRTVKYDGGIVKVQSGGGSLNESVKETPVNNEQISQQIDYKKERMELNRAEIARQEEIIEDSIKRYEESLMYRESNIKFTDTESYEYSKRKIETLTAENEKLQTEITELERQRAEQPANK